MRRLDVAVVAGSAGLESNRESISSKWSLESDSGDVDELELEDSEELEASLTLS